MQGDSNLIHRKSVVPFVPYRSERLASVVQPGLQRRRICLSHRECRRMLKTAAKPAGSSFTLWAFRRCEIDLSKMIVGVAIIADGTSGTSVGSTSSWRKMLTCGTWRTKAARVPGILARSSDSTMKLVIRFHDLSLPLGQAQVPL